MAKGTQQPQAVTVRYDLYDLPTAQHKAGLAGLLLQIESMKERVEHGVLPANTPLVEVVAEGPTHAEFRFTAESMQALFDDLYEAEHKLIWVDNKWQGKTPLDERQIDDPKTGKPKRQHQYEVTQPLGPFLARYTDDGKEVWHKLWRDMLWAIPRGKPTTRGPFNARAAGKPTKDGAEAWKTLIAHEKASKRGNFKTVEVASAVMLGAQAINAEAVKFEDRADHALLLHFWQLTARIFVPEQVDPDGKRNFVGYVLAIPEPSDLPEFAIAYKRGLEQLKPDKRGYRPAEAIISLPAEGSLEFMRHLARLAEQQVIHKRPASYLAGVEFFHVVKIGNNIKSADHGRVPPREPMLRAYEGLRSSVRNPLMLAGRLRALLGNRPWFAALADDLMEREWSFFFHSTKEGHHTPPSMIGFAYDADHRFKVLIDNYEKMKEAGMTHSQEDTESVDRLIYDLVHKYVRVRACNKAGLEESAPDWWNEAADERRDVASKLFLELRSRAGDDFVRHFTATIGSVPQWLKEPQYIVVASALMREYTDEIGENRPRTRDDVKTLTLLALSAASRSLTNKKDDETQTQKTTQETST